MRRWITSRAKAAWCGHTRKMALGATARKCTRHRATANNHGGAMCAPIPLSGGAMYETDNDVVSAYLQKRGEYERALIQAKQLAKRERERGKTLREIGDMFNVNKEAVRNWLHGL